MRLKRRNVAFMDLNTYDRQPSWRNDSCEPYISHSDDIKNANVLSKSLDDK